MKERAFEPIITDYKKGWKRLLSFMGPAYLISVGYMDPGNWATDLAAGSRYGYSLLWVIVLSSISAVLLQSHSARLGIVTGKDIAQFSRSYYPRGLNFVYWIFAEIAIAATDLAEILGLAIGLNLLFGIDIIIGVIFSLFDTLIIMVLVKRGIRRMEAIIIAMISIIGLCFAVELFFARPDTGELVKGLIPSLPDNQAIYLAVGIIGATIMPHNLYLHSSLVQTRQINSDDEGKRSALRYNLIDTVIALGLALFVNASILILAAAVFHRTGNAGIEDITEAHKLLSPLLGTAAASVLFALALVASGQSSTLTGTLTGQIVMEGYLNLRIAPWLRRIITRLVAIVPAVITIGYAGEEKTTQLLIFSQVILGLLLGFAVIPVINWVSSEKIMGKFRISRLNTVISWGITILIIILNYKVVYDFLTDLINTSSSPVIITLLTLPPVVISLLFLFYAAAEPVFEKFYSKEISSPHPQASVFKIEHPAPFRKIGIGIDFGRTDISAINHALRIGTPETQYILIHVVESAAARALPLFAAGKEAETDMQELQKYADDMRQRGINAECSLKFGDVSEAFVKTAQENGIELLVMASHNKGTLHRLFRGTVISEIARKVNIPVFIVK